MARTKAGNNITDPAQIRHLSLLSARQFGILLGHSESTVLRWIREGLVTPYTALDTSNLLIRIEEVDRFLERQEAAERERRERLQRRRNR